MDKPSYDISKGQCASCAAPGMSRRGFLRVGSLAPLGISLAQFLEAPRVPAANNKTDRSCGLPPGV